MNGHGLLRIKAQYEIGVGFADGAGFGRIGAQVQRMLKRRTASDLTERAVPDRLKRSVNVTGEDIERLVIPPHEPPELLAAIPQGHGVERRVA